MEVGENWLEGYRIVAEERFAMYLDEMTSIKNRDEMPHSGPVRPGKPHGSYVCHLQDDHSGFRNRQCECSWRTVYCKERWTMALWSSMAARLQTALMSLAQPL